MRAGVGNVAKALTLEVTANLVKACPVKYGHARANFVPSVGTVFSGEDGSTVAQQAGMAQVTSYKLGDGPLHITNNVPYVPFLIAGSSSQAPAGWDLVAIDQAVQTIRGQYPDIEISLGGAVAAISAERGAAPAGNLASAYSPFGGDE